MKNFAYLREDSPFYPIFERGMAPIKWNKTAICTQCGYAELIGSDDCRNCRRNFAEEHRRRPRVFCASLADVFDPEVPIEWLADLLALIYATQNLDWLLLTKRPENLRPRMQLIVDLIPRCEITYEEASVRALADAFLTTGGTILSNVWLGVSVEDQARADERIPLLLEIPAGVHFLSCEPLLGAVDISGVCTDAKNSGFAVTDGFGRFDGEGPPRLHWVICGGESGHHARPMHPDWARSLRDQCAAAGVSFFFKQWGEWIEGFSNVDRCEFVAKFPMSGAVVGTAERCSMTRVGKKRAGRLLDGVEFSEFPQPSREATARQASSFGRAAQTDRPAACAPQT